MTRKLQDELLEQIADDLGWFRRVATGVILGVLLSLALNWWRNR